MVSQKASKFNKMTTKITIREDTSFIKVTRLAQPDELGNTLVLVQYDIYNVIQKETNFGLEDDTDGF